MAQNARQKSNEVLETITQYHPLQRMASPSRSLSLALHLLGLASFTYSYNYLISNPNHINASFGWHFQYLTIIGLTLSTLTFTLAILSDTTLSPRLFQLKNLFSMASAPLALLISLLYWGLRLIDPALVVPPELELPLSADLGFHASPSVFLVMDLLLFSPPWTITIAPAMALSGAIAVGYWGWIELCFSRNGFYPYPLFEVLDQQGRVALFGGSAVVMAGSTAVLKWCQERFNRSLQRKARVGAVKRG